MPVIGWPSGNAPVAAASPLAVEFRKGLGEAGYLEGQNVDFESPRPLHATERIE
ncbi:MAG: hypothetical protein ISP45_30515 [Reyranella sp.]|nr:hypothetical protein [Reyranella sp.]